MKLKFDSNLEYQREAIKSITDVFEGLPKERESSEQDLGKDEGAIFSSIVMGNSGLLSENLLLKNVQTIQLRNHIPKSLVLIPDKTKYAFPNFSIEMETGTGKTYVYLKTIFELNKLYGYKKFIIVVPSVAIREGVTSSIELMKDHFKKLYDNVAFDHFVYQSKDINKVRVFAENNEIQIMVINIQAFQRDAGEGVDYNSLTEEQKKKLAVINREQDRMPGGRRPIEFIQATNPIVIIDEPQSVDNTEKSQKAIKNLNPLFALRYSATHINPYNLLYLLDPIKAYDMRIVKQIEVVDASGGKNFNDTYIRLDAVGYWPNTSTIPKAKISIYIDTPNGPKEKQIKVKHGADLMNFTTRQDYEGYLITNINAEPENEYIEFQNGKTIELYHEAEGTNDDRLKNQIRQTVLEHFAKEKKLKNSGIKVLSLFFIDHVKSYRSYDEQGNKQKEKLAQWFEEMYTEISSNQLYKGVIDYTASEVHDGYFSADRKKGKVVEELDTNGDTSKDDETYELIMKDKEKLLDVNTPLRFVFSHSALREGWDNPNVFQICTLRDIGSDRERRQTIGRGLRLPVNSNTGERVYDEQINRLTVIANESFEQFARGLQSDIEAAIDPSGNFRFGRVPEIAFASLINKDGSAYLTQEESKQIWDHIQLTGLIDNKGDFTEQFLPDDRNFTITLPPEYNGLEKSVLEKLIKYLPREFVKDARKRQKVTYNKRVELNTDFKELWDKISQKTKYSVEFESKKLIEKASDKITKMPSIKKTQIEITKRGVQISEAGVEGDKIISNRTYELSNKQSLPDILSFLQRETELTRSTLVQILKKSGKLNEFVVNPTIFMTEVARHINKALNELIIDGIKYEPIPGQYFDMKLFEQGEVEKYLNNIYRVSNTENKTPYDYVEFQSNNEKTFAKLLDDDEKVKFFCKLPSWFKVNTPMGTYNPDWAVVVEETKKLYLVRETKTSMERDDLRESENKKIDCGKAHFKAIGVNYKVATNISEMLEE